jgi:prepilin peptidase CpaA
MTAVSLVALTVGAAAVVEDLARRRVSNWISGAALISGLAVHAHLGWRGLATAAAGAAVGFAVFAVFYFLHGMGGGDVKLMAGFGSLLGPGTILCAAWIAAVAGGLMAVASAVVLAARPTASEGRAAARAEAIPYAPAIVAGVWLAEMARG